MGGYAMALSSNRRMIAIPLSAGLAFSVVVVLVVLLDRPHQHLSRVTQPAMLDLQDTMRRSVQSESTSAGLADPDLVSDDAPRTGSRSPDSP